MTRPLNTVADTANLRKTDDAALLERAERGANAHGRVARKKALLIWVNDEEHARVSGLAAKAGVSTGQFVRDLVNVGWGSRAQVQS